MKKSPFYETARTIEQPHQTADKHSRRNATWI